MTSLVISNRHRQDLPGSSIRVRVGGAIALAILFVAEMFSSAYAGGESSFELTGDILQVAVPAGAFLSTLYLGDYEGSSQFTYAFATNLAVTYGLKVAINKPRPEGHGNYSFPSGHTSAAFQGATFIQQRYGWRYGIPAYLCASYVGWSRIEGESDKHDLADVLGGAAIGILSSAFFTTSYDGVTVTPVAGSDYYGVSVNFAW